ncbi:4Fe-4S binding protein [Clostridium swellfunianum]|uniref:[Fe-Fe] hydrogenase large subunit C-terminal domain-containing protein n=1 Tax=Clostridium swellfunianum TaxID=1367462 RepID=UPI00202EE36E|nr:[Fe-Fe] hydrogenase large subunit C-terminal domain-containing protein [Clostridium swellfunianum]MCM0650954.1 4Fe-4S binding protein [Clostridium swellfunianum]
MELINFSKANCRSCYKCLRSCPVKAIRIKNDQAKIVEDRCVACGQCLVVCPQNARQIKSDLFKIKNAILTGKTTIAIVAPSFAGAFSMEAPGQLVSALKKLGFDRVEEVALGAQIVTNLYNEYMNSTEKKNFITTSCPSVNYLIETYYPTLVDYLIPVDSPMLAHGKVLKNEYPDCFVTFVGPCTAKKFESVDKGNLGIIDAVLTFDELHKLLEERKIDLNNVTPTSFDKNGTLTGRLFPVPGKLSLEFKSDKLSHYENITVDGMDRCVQLFNAMEKGDIDNVIVEALACRGGCINGPAMPKDEIDFFSRKRSINKYLKENMENAAPCNLESIASINFTKEFKDKSLEPSVIDEEKITQILHKLGKYTPSDELNCGVCGYNTCREKAQAVLDGMAELNMCIHYIRNKAESITNVVFETSPNAIFTLDEDLLVKDFNPASESMFKVKYEDIKNKHICLLMDDSNFYKVKDSKENIVGNRVTIPELDLVVLENIIYLENHGMFLVIINDITMQEKSKGELAIVKEKTLDAAQAVIEKQMRVAQEIASLLGETTAETKVILTKLKAIALGEMSGGK